MTEVVKQYLNQYVDKIKLLDRNRISKMRLKTLDRFKIHINLKDSESADFNKLKLLCQQGDQLELWQTVLEQNVKAVGAKRVDEWPVSTEIAPNTYFSSIADSTF